jgi:low temperature requirement protein LtrA
VAELARRPWHRVMTPRRVGEEHRAATPLELFYDLCFVVAVALAADQLHHSLSEGTVAHAVRWFLLAFFGIWLAWMNFTWFASAYDTDDGPYRLTTLVQIAGALVFAAGIEPADDRADLGIVVVGFAIMRLAMVTQWLRAARFDPEHRKTALRYAGGIAALQVGWGLRLLLPERWFWPSVVVVVLGELLVPPWAERATRTTWHPRHIAERHGLFTMIVLGESIFATTTAVESAIVAGEADLHLVLLAAAGLVIVFAMWWLYFDRPVHHLLRSSPQAMFWWYGHYVVFAAVAAVGAGLQTAVDYETHHSHLGPVVTDYATAVPVAVFLASLWLLHVRPDAEVRGRALLVAYPLAATLVLLSPLTPLSTYLVALIMAALIAVTALAPTPRFTPA